MHTRSIVGTAALFLGACGAFNASPDAPTSPTPTVDDGGAGAREASANPSAFTIGVPSIVALRTNLTADVAISIGGPTPRLPITITFSGLPSGVTAQPIAIGAAESSATAKLVTTAAAKQGPAAVTVTAVDTSGNKQEATLKVDVFGAPGSVDSSFGTNGVMTFDAGFPARCADVEVLPDRKIVLLVDGRDDSVQYRLTKLLTDGSYDVSFGTNGSVGKAAAGANPISLLQQPDGALVAFGAGDSDGVAGKDFLALRFTPAGVLDNGFGAAGLASIGLGNGKNAGSAGGRRRSDGSFMTLGNRDGIDLLYSVFTKSGAVGTGPVVTALGTLPSNWEWTPPLVLADDSVVVLGQFNDFVSAGISRLLKLDAAGHPLLAFGGSGLGWIDLSTDPDVKLLSMAVQPDGKLVVTGQLGLGNPKLTVYRTDSGGRLDTTFGTNGHREYTFGAASFNGDAAVAVDAQGRIVIGGGADFHFSVMRLLPDGAPDTTFGAAGTLVLPALGTPGDFMSAMRIGPDGRIVLAGLKDGPGAGEGAPMVARVNP